MVTIYQSLYDHLLGNPAVRTPPKDHKPN